MNQGEEKKRKETDAMGFTDVDDDDADAVPSSQAAAEWSLIDGEVPAREREKERERPLPPVCTTAKMNSA